MKEYFRIFEKFIATTRFIFLLFHLLSSHLGASEGANGKNVFFIIIFVYYLVEKLILCAPKANEKALLDFRRLQRRKFEWNEKPSSLQLLIYYER